MPIRRCGREDGSPLAAITAAQARALQARLGDSVVVRHAMRYGRPDIAGELAALKDAGCERILFAPLYPQYSRRDDRARRSMRWPMR